MYLSNLPAGRIAGTCLLTLLAATQVGNTPAKAELPTSGSLTVQISGLKNAEGQVCFSLYDSSAGFPNDAEAIVAQQCIAADSEIVQTQAENPTDGTAATEALLSVTFSELSMGTYAVSVLHDENEDEQINRGTFGIPTEGFGFSRNPVVQTSAPEFYETAVFVFGSTTTEIEMVYF
ncbi:MAG: DUF2141 domain-containing protein [Phormidesmis sp.]